ncbi:hypothetical protein BZG36_04490 [Bifiguratus adelaidae]|uniref:Uncharacterized protein n=1 Tax=Bifiguratus adelaidae TaxID=1938954 RepID=A0A261XYD0_9FUNG|nr:hypothetical protein BZG36_04490 [Bifiguratus adelaidae]
MAVGDDVDGTSNGSITPTASRLFSEDQDVTHLLASVKDPSVRSDLAQAFQQLALSNTELANELKELNGRYQKAVREIRWFTKRHHKQQQLEGKKDAETMTEQSRTSSHRRPHSPVVLPPAPPSPPFSTASAISTATHTTTTTGSGHSDRSEERLIPVVHTTIKLTPELFNTRRVQPLEFGGSEGFWDAMDRGKVDDLTMEKILSNYFRRGGNPNAARQHASTTRQLVCHGTGMLHAAILRRHTKAIKLILVAGANPNALTLCHRQEDICTPLYLAARDDLMDVLLLLLDHGADLGRSIGWGNQAKTVLIAAVEFDHVNMARYLLDACGGALVDQADSLGVTALHLACFRGNLEMVYVLIGEYQANTHVSDKNGETPLHYAARKGFVPILDSLINDYGVDPNIVVTPKTGTPLDSAKNAPLPQKKAMEYLTSVGGMTWKMISKQRKEMEKEKKMQAVMASTLKKNFG